MSNQVLLHLTDVGIPEAARKWIDAGNRRVKQIDWFDFVPSDYGVVYTVLSALRRGRFCEWGSGLGIVSGLAEMLGYEAVGVEMHEPLADLSRQLLREFNLNARIEVGDYFELNVQADLYFTYCWPNRVIRTQERFQEIAPAGASLLIYYGRNDVQWMQKSSDASHAK